MSTNISHGNDFIDEKKESGVDHVEFEASTEQVLIEQAMLRGEEETKLGFKGIVKLHWPAAVWSMALS